jgi:hypothetical protein
VEETQVLHRGSGGGDTGTTVGDVVVEETQVLQ